MDRQRLPTRFLVAVIGHGFDPISRSGIAIGDRVGGCRSRRSSPFGVIPSDDRPGPRTIWLITMRWLHDQPNLDQQVGCSRPSGDGGIRRRLPRSMGLRRGTAGLSQSSRCRGADEREASRGNRQSGQGLGESSNGCRPRRPIQASRGAFEARSRRERLRIGCMKPDPIPGDKVLPKALGIPDRRTPEEREGSRSVKQL
jgi:hypothetical protein